MEKKSKKNAVHVQTQKDASWLKQTFHMVDDGAGERSSSHGPCTLCVKAPQHRSVSDAPLGCSGGKMGSLILCFLLLCTLWVTVASDPVSVGY